MAGVREGSEEQEQEQEQEGEGGGRIGMGSGFLCMIVKGTGIRKI